MNDCVQCGKPITPENELIVYADPAFQKPLYSVCSTDCLANREAEREREKISMFMFGLLDAFGVSF